MTRLKATIAYDGTDFYGWQIQKGYPTIQSAIQDCLYRISQKKVEVTGAGRTDSGVHAFEQVAHFDWEHRLSCEKLLLGMNGLLPPAIRILSLEEVSADFHARFDAKTKTYVYRINRRRVFSPFTYRYSWHYPFFLDLDLIHTGAEVLEGEHDFAAFQATGTDVVSTIRRLIKVEIIPESETMDLLQIRLTANGFLRKMARFLVGTLVEIAHHRRPLEHLELALKTGDRQYAGVPAPARGLFLEKVAY